MTASNFPAALQFVLAQEGGWSNDPHDPGGATNKGITLRTFQSFQHGATAEDLRHISDAMVSTIYHREYWGIMGCDGLPPGVDLCVFDAGVNLGPARAVGMLQAIVGVRRDGIDGAMTQAAAAHMSALTIITRFAGLRKAWYRALPTWPDFGQGWEQRVERCTAAAIRMTPPRVVEAIQA